jgi:acetylornithine deacetylase/succinyl-diaminopimelate desuccinylase-like protein
VVRGPRSYVDEHERDADELPALAEGDASSGSPIPVVQMRWREADRAFRIGRKKLSAMQAKIDAERVPMSGPTGSNASLSVELIAQMKAAPNVLGMIRGSEKPDEIVVLGAHFDHIGTDEEGHGHCRAVQGAEKRDAICNGADDNASGTAVVMEVARVLASGPAPRRTVVFALFSGEEIGLHGSRALADAPPNVAPFAGGKIVAMINIDMVGRLGEKGLAIGGVGSSPGWMKLFDEIGTFGIPTLYDRSVTTRSDHANFYRHDIPVVFFFTGTHADYHRPGDEAALINRGGLASIGELTFALVKKLGDGHKIPFAAPATPAEGLVGALPGDNAATVERRVGFPEQGGDASRAAVR